MKHIIKLFLLLFCLVPSTTLALDGKVIAAFQSKNSNSTKGALVLYTIKQSTIVSKTKLLEGDIAKPTFCRDGSRIVYVNADNYLQFVNISQSQNATIKSILLDGYKPIHIEWPMREWLYFTISSVNDSNPDGVVKVDISKGTFSKIPTNYVQNKKHLQVNSSFENPWENLLPIWFKVYSSNLNFGYSLSSRDKALITIWERNTHNELKRISCDLANLCQTKSECKISRVNWSSNSPDWLSFVNQCTSSPDQSTALLYNWVSYESIPIESEIQYNPQDIEFDFNITSQEPNSNLLALFDFGAIQNSIITNKASNDRSTDLHIKASNLTSSSKSNLQVLNPAVISSSSIESIRKALFEKKALSIEIWFRPLKLFTEKNSTILSIGSDRKNPVLSIYQEHSNILIQNSASSKKKEPLCLTGIIGKKPMYLTITIDNNSNVLVYINGQTALKGSFQSFWKSWPSFVRLFLANDSYQRSPWTGEFYFVAIHNRVFPQSEIGAKFTRDNTNYNAIAANSNLSNNLSFIKKPYSSRNPFVVKYDKQGNLGIKVMLSRAYTIEVISTDGRKLPPLQGNKPKEFLIPRNQLTNGMYMVRLTTNEKNAYSKMVVVY